ncbi:hypothetical protein DBR39_13640 [Chryseobacterium sp. KBW03]|uniref:hypothetical protein n=1 Tax=Chryseobacterium sp. KBW03 TaxID=2153362 RepID=UPI000F58FE5D|nr:hypothetical protein [Chryseobacterium sp. KBW03]RQO37926.1 hypothetical protein DBR39_13640 [Chryseobacterium sp. KBW03]
MNPKEELKQIFADRTPVDIAIEISGYTGHRTTLIDELTEAEASGLLAVYNPSVDLEKEHTLLQQVLIKKEWRSKILAKAEKIKIKKPNSFFEFNDWMQLKSKFKKHLNSHSIQELKELHQQLCAFESNNSKSAKKPFTKSWWDKGTEKINLN